MKELVRQSKFNPDGTVTDVSTRDTERKQYEKQGDLILWARERELLNEWEVMPIENK